MAPPQHQWGTVTGGSVAEESVAPEVWMEARVATIVALTAMWASRVSVAGIAAHGSPTMASFSSAATLYSVNTSPDWTSTGSSFNSCYICLGS